MEKAKTIYPLYTSYTGGITNNLACFFFFFFFYLLLRRSISDHYLRSCGYVTFSRPQRTATGGLEPGTSRPKVLGFTTAPVRSTSFSIKTFAIDKGGGIFLSIKVLISLHTFTADLDRYWLHMLMRWLIYYHANMSV